MSELTPMMRQYLELKEQNPDAILMFRLGDFYEMFFEDAVTASRELELTLTGRDCGLPERAPMCGVPWHSVDGYIARLISRGFKVAIAEQTEEPGKGKTLVRREVVRVITPGTYAEDSGAAHTKNRFIAAVYYAGKRAGVALCDVATGEFFVRAFPEGEAAAAAFLQSQQPMEALSNDTERLQAAYGGYITQVRAEHFARNRAREQINQQFAVKTPEAVGIPARDELLVCPAGALLRYLSDTQMVALKHITKVTVLRGDMSMPLPAATRRSLELVARLDGRGGKGTLLHELDRTQTAMGARLLRSWVERPLIDRDLINERLDCVAALVQDPVMQSEVSALLKQVYDLERLLSKLSYRTLNPRDCLALLRSIEQAPLMGRLLAGLPQPGFAALNKLLAPQPALAELLRRAIAEDAPVALSDGGVIRAGYDAQLDETRLAARDGRKWISDLEAREREATGIKNLKIQYNRVFGYFFEVTRSNYGLVPAHFVRRQTLANAERFFTPELKEYESRVLGADDRIRELEYDLFVALRSQVAERAASLRLLARALSELDVLASFAETALDQDWVRPEIVEENVLDLEASRHPVVESSRQGQFVPNDCYLDSEKRLIILTGPNMSGKSTWLRQVALVAILAQMGSYVPARRARLGITDRVFTRVGASDDLHLGQSTFMVEMSETANIVNHATPRSLVVLDEIGRGTSTFDGLAIARAVAEHMHDKVRARTLFATHFHEMTRLERNLPGCRNFRVAVRENLDEIVFLHRIVPGGADRSYGIYVARLAGLPPEVLQRAQALLRRMEGESRRRHREPVRARGQQLGLFRASDDLEDLVAEGDLSPAWAGEAPPGSGSADRTDVS